MLEFFIWGYDIEEIFKFIYLDFCQFFVVFVDDMVSVIRERVWSRFSKNVINMGVSYNFQ